MGWTVTTEKHNPDFRPTTDCLQAVLDAEGIPRDTVVEHSLTTQSPGRFVIYMAIRCTDAAVRAFVSIVERDVDAERGTEEVRVKTMNEGMGPRYYSPEKNVLAALSPTTDREALSWRKRASREADLQREARPRSTVTRPRFHLHPRQQVRAGKLPTTVEEAFAVLCDANATQAQIDAAMTLVG